MRKELNDAFAYNLQQKCTGTSSPSGLLKLLVATAICQFSRSQVMFRLLY